MNHKGIVVLASLPTNRRAKTNDAASDSIMPISIRNVLELI
jgi:hypothetical protein